MTSIVCEAWKRKELVLWLVKCKIAVCELVIRPVWLPTTHASQQNQKPHGRNKNITAKPKTSRQKQNTSWQNQKPHGKTKYFTAKPNSWPNTSQQKQNSFGFAVGICFCREVFGFCCEVFGFAVRFLVLLWGILFLPWSFWFCCEVFVFAVRFLVLLWQLWATVDPPLPPPC